MTEIDVPDWVAADVLSRYSAAQIERSGEVWPPEAALRQRQEDMRAALTAALGAWVVPVYQIRSQVQRSWVEVKPDSYALILSDNDDEFYEGRILYDLRQEKPDEL